MEIRTFTPELEVRAKGDGRTIVGIAVPYGRAVRINSRLIEQFARSAFNDQLGPMRPGSTVLTRANVVRFHDGHDEHGNTGPQIGMMSLARDDANGLYAEFRVARTDEGDQVLADFHAGRLPHLSVGFEERENRTIAGAITERVRAWLDHVAIVPQGAYGGMAAVTAVRTPAGAARGPRLRYNEARAILANLPTLPPVP